MDQRNQQNERSKIMNKRNWEKILENSHRKTANVKYL